MVNQGPTGGERSQPHEGNFRHTIEEGDAMIDETLRSLAGAGTHLIRTLPLLSGLFGGSARLDLSGRVVFITGAARGLGAEIARPSHARGARVAVVGRRLDPLQELADELGERAAAFQADVTDFAALQRAARDTKHRFGGIDVVVANAGVAPPSETVASIDPAEFERTIDIDLLGQWRTIRATLPEVTERQGHILVVGSIYAFFNGVLNASYAASKAGVEQLIRAVRVELAPHGATAGVAYLGFIDTDLAADVFAQGHIDDVRKAMPGFITQPMPVAEAAAAVIDGIEHRSPRVTAPAWVSPMLTFRGITTTLMDELALHHPGVARAINRVETGHDLRSHS
jgi:NAD(P)-dependent dehydrogenase (short-subunit alcohol dehydrogenase family)